MTIPPYIYLKATKKNKVEVILKIHILTTKHGAKLTHHTTYTFRIFESGASNQLVARSSRAGGAISINSEF